MSVDEGVDKLVKLAAKQGHVTYDEINETFPDRIFSPEDLDKVYVKLVASDVQIVDLTDNANN